MYFAMIGAVILARAQRRELLSRDSRRSEKTHPIKLLFWDGTGLWLCSKRLEKGRFNWPMECDGSVRMRLSQEELTLLLGGIDLRQTKARKLVPQNALRA